MEQSVSKQRKRKPIRFKRIAIAAVAAMVVGGIGIPAFFSFTT